MGHDIPKPRLTAWAWFWISVYLGAPVLLVGTLLDTLTTWFTGHCSGLWCWLL
jgi:hypothetical protein